MAARFGVFVPQGWRMDLVGIDDPIEQFEAMTHVAQVADNGPWDSIWVYDHFHTRPEPTLNSVFESWTISATLSRDTERIHIGQMVNCNGYRNPALFAKIASTVDTASHGRLYAGYGAGWYEHEWRAYGYGFPDTPDRMKAFREGVQIIHKMWTEDYPEFSGNYYSIDKPINEPKSAIPGRKVPLWIGGGGEQVTLKLVAQYADACNVGGGNAETIRHKLEVLQGHCDKVGRNYDEITKSTSFAFYPVGAGVNAERATATLRETMGGLDMETFGKRAKPASPAEIVETVQAALDAGANYGIFYIPGLAYDHELLHLMEEEVLAKLG